MGVGIRIEIPDYVIREIAERAAALVERRDDAATLPRWVNKRGAADHLAFSVSKIEKLTSKDLIPHHHDGGRIHYRTDELDDWLRSR